MDIKQRGIFIFTEGTRANELGEMVQRLDALGYGAVWYPEAVGREPFSTAAFILSKTQNLSVATGIMNIYWRDPVVTAMGQQTLTELSGGRFVLGLGVSHRPFVEGRGLEYAKPLAAMRNYVTQLREAHGGVSILRNAVVEGFEDAPTLIGSANEPNAITAEVGTMPVILAALGPKMTALAGEISQGSHPYNTTPAHTAQSREILGPDPWLCPMLRVCLTTDADKARTIGRQVLGIYMDLPNYRNSWKREGFTDDDLSNGGSDRFIDAIMTWGDEKALEARVQEHLDAGASHVCIQPINPDNPSLPCMRAIEALAPH